MKTLKHILVSLLFAFIMGISMACIFIVIVIAIELCDYIFEGAFKISWKSLFKYSSYAYTVVFILTFFKNLISLK